jgi:E3 ubiquitin-protein ligase SIAH1
MQCDVGHVLCSPCRDKLKGAGTCHVCGVAMGAGGYRRCHAMERVVDSVRGPCPNARYGCDATPAYHGRVEHLLACPHAPCHCPGEACGFVGSTAALLDHISAEHRRWPCITDAEVDANHLGEYTLRLDDGFNFLLADCPIANKMSRGATASIQCLLLLNVLRQPFGRTISVVWIGPHAGATAVRGGEGRPEMECSLWYYHSWRRNVNDQHGGSNQVCEHYQQSTFRVACPDLSNGMPNTDGCFQFVLPSSVTDEDHDDDGIQVTVRRIAIK